MRAPHSNLAAGSFFGKPSIHIETPSFQFAELNATVADREVPRHTHETPHFVLVLEGVYVTEARNQDGLCPPGTLIYNPGATTHRDRFRTAHGRFLGITPSAATWHLLERAAPVSVIVSNPLSRLVAAQALVEDLRRAAVTDYESLGIELIGITTQVSDEPRLAPGWLELAKGFMDDQLDQDLLIAQIAHSVGVHPVALARAFRRHFRCSPGEYQRRARLARLRVALETNASLAQAALECGFSDQSQMTRAFTRAFGLSPGRYRRLCFPEGFQNDKIFADPNCQAGR